MNPYFLLVPLVSIKLLQTLSPRWNNVKVKLHQCCFNVVSMSDTDVLSTLCNVENPASDFVSFSTSDQPYFNIDSQHWINADPTLKCWLGKSESRVITKKIHHILQGFHYISGFSLVFSLRGHLVNQNYRRGIGHYYKGFRDTRWKDKKNFFPPEW